MRIEIDPIMCEAHGLCAELLPELITLDEWGYPVLEDTPVPADLQALARRAVSVCPTLALRLSAIDAVAPGTAPRPARPRTPPGSRTPQPRPARSGAPPPRRSDSRRRPPSR